MTTWKILFALLALSPTAVAQVRTPARLRVSEAVTYGIADRKVLPDIADLKGQKLKADVELVMIIAKTGDVESARAFKGDPRLFKRTEEAALKWHYKPYTINGYPFELETTLKFRFTRDKVKIVVPSPR